MSSERIRIVDSYPLSPIQEGMLFHSLYAHRSGVDVEQMVCSLSEPIDGAAMERAWQAVAIRHPALRTSFQWEGRTSPVQQVHACATVPFQNVDWRGFDPSQQRDRLDAYLQTDRRRAFDLSRAPLMRVALFRRCAAEYWLVWTFHHGILDGRSFPVLLKEVFAFHEAFRDGRSIDPGPVRPYREYIDWLGREKSAEAELFWRRKLRGLSSPTRLPLGPERGRDLGSAAFAEDARELEETLSLEVTSALRTLAADNGVTLNTIVQGAWALLLWRYSGDRDVVFGVTRATRPRELSQGPEMVGLFINTIPMRLTVTPEALLIPWLQGVRAEHVALRPYEHTPLVQIQEWSELPRGKPVFDNILLFDNYQLDPLLRAQGGAWVNRSFQLREKTNYPLSVGAYGGRELLLNLAFMESALDAPAAAQVLRSLRTVLEGMAERPHVKLSELPVLSAEDRSRVLTAWNDTPREYGEGTIHQLFEESVARDPEAVAAELGAERLTYGELNSRANRLAHHLRGLGAGPEAVVGMSLERSLDAIVTMLAIWKSGAAYLPLDPALPEERLRFMLAETGAAFIVTRKSMPSSLPTDASRMIYLDSDAPAIERQPDGDPSGGAAESNLAVVLFTSGSTGKPKGVMLPHRGLRHRLLWGREIYRLTEADRVLHMYSVSFDFAIWEIFTPLVAGGRVVMAPPGVAQDPSEVTRLIAERGVTMAGLIPSMLDALLEDPGIRNCGSLRIASVGGDALTVSLSQKFRSRLDAELQNAYGPTEASIDVTWWVDRAESDRAGRDTTIPIGRPNANVRLYVLDPRMSLVPPGVPGELYIAGPSLARGYFRRPELTAEKFVPDPFTDVPGGRLYRTGDLARHRSDGSLEFLGRADTQVKVRGYRIELGEIEARLAEHPAIDATVVMALEEEAGDKRLVAYVAPKGLKPSVSDLRDFLRSRVPAYMVPAVFVFLDAFPRLPNGKIDARALPNPASTAEVPETVRIAPSDDVERKLLKIWERVLRVSPISIQSNYFDLGGHSLLAPRLFGQIETTFGRKLPLATIFRAPTIEKLAAILRQGGWSPDWSSLVAIQPAGWRPPFYCVHAVGGNVLTYMDLARHMGSDQPVYGLQAQGLDGKRQPHRTIQEMAAHYVSEIVKLQPEGPYSMGGSSAGGIVAFEMAQQLVAQGKKVGVLALFDTWGPGYPKPLPGVTAVRMRLFHFLDRVDLHFGNFLVAEGVKEKLAYLVTKSRRLRNNIRLAGRKRWSKLKKLPNALLNPLPRALRDVENMGVRATELYEPKPYPGRVTLFRASKQPAGVLSDPELGWGSVALGGVDVYEVPGRHGAIVYEPRIRILAEQLRICLRRFEEESLNPSWDVEPNRSSGLAGDHAS